MEGGKRECERYNVGERRPYSSRSCIALSRRGRERGREEGGEREVTERERQEEE